MAHLVESMAWTGEKPWHRLGFEVSNDLTPHQMMKAAKVDWSVDKVPAVSLINGEYVDTGHSSLVRSSDNKILDVITNDWEPTQNETAFEFFQQFTESGQMSMETAGSLDGGRNIWALAKINKAFEAVRGDVIQGYLLFSNPHKYGRGITIRFTPIRVVCNNTLTYALSTKKTENMSVSVNHRKTFNAELVKETLGISEERMNSYKETSQFLASKNFNQEQLREYLRRVFPSIQGERELSRPATTALGALESQPGAEFGHGTFWQAFNTVTFATDHLLGRSSESRLNSAWFGINKDRKIRALNIALEMASA